MTQTDLISVAPVDAFELDIELAKLDKFPDLPLAVHYLILKDEGLSMEAIVAQLQGKFGNVPQTRQGLYGRIESWRIDGTLREAEAFYLAPKIEELRAVTQQVISGYTAGLAQMAKDVQNKDISLKTRTEAMEFLRANVVAPRLSQEETPGTVEKKYAQKVRTFTPTDVE